MQVLIAGILAISFMIMDYNNQTLLVCTSSLIIPSVAIFGNLARVTFESLLFLFIMHPFDVGDRITVEGVPLLVEVIHTKPPLFILGSFKSPFEKKSLRHYVKFKPILPYIEELIIS